MSPVTVQLRADTVEHVSPPGEEVTTYPVSPVGTSGSVQVMVAELFEGTTEIIERVSTVGGT